MIQLQAMLYQISFNMQKRQVLTDRNSKLNLIFRQQFKTTIRQKVIELRVDHAFHLLMLGETIAASDKSGFNDYFYFLKCFKKNQMLYAENREKTFLPVTAGVHAG
jgi:YesN/AraC family two-component response regulator